MTPDERLQYERMLRKLDFKLDSIRLQSEYLPEVALAQMPTYVIGSIMSWVGHKFLDLTK